MMKFKRMVNDCVAIGLNSDASTLSKLTKLTYSQLGSYETMFCYKLCAISHAAGILANRKKSLARGFKPRRPYARRALLISCYSFKILEGKLRVPIQSEGRGHHSTTYFDIPLNEFTKKILSDPAVKIRSFTLTSSNMVSICYAKEIVEMQCSKLIGADRNLHNLTVGNVQQVVQYDLSEAVQVAENTRSIFKSFKRNDVRIRRKLYRKYGLRRKNRVNQLLHRMTKTIVRQAKEEKTAIVFEDVSHIRRLYRKGNHQSRYFRARLNDWSFFEVKRQIEYKARWEGLPVIQLSRGETRGTSQLCPHCGKKITQVDRLTRQLFCDGCKKWMDRDVVAAMNISIKGLARFASSQGLAGEVMVLESSRKEPVIRRVDASKLTFVRRLKS